MQLKYRLTVLASTYSALKKTKKNCIKHLEIATILHYLLINLHYSPLFSLSQMLLDKIANITKFLRL